MGNESNGSNVPVDINAQAKKACGWFAAIAAFSVINSLLIFFKSQVTFVIGLGITTIIDGFMSGMREEVSGNASIIITARSAVLLMYFFLPLKLKYSKTTEFSIPF